MTDQDSPQPEQGPDSDQPNSDQLSPEQINPLITQAASHLLALVAAIALWAAADVWALLTDLAVSSFFAVFASVVFGFVMAHIFHEWGHFAGAVYGGASYTVKSQVSPLFFDFDLTANSARQFELMSIGGSLGNVLFLLLLIFFIPFDSAGRDMLFAIALGMATFVAVLEWPVINLVRSGEAPTDALVKQFTQAGIFQRAITSGLVVTALVWIAL